MIIFTKHALERMKQRAITREEVIHALTTSKIRLTDNLGNSIKQLEDNGKILRVVFVKRGKDIVVITSYRTSREKYRNI